MIDDTELIKRFTYHPPKPGQPEIYQTIRENALNFARCIVALSPASREQSLAITALEETSMWANAAIARNPVEETDPRTLYPEVLLSGEPGEKESSIKRDALTRLNQLDEQAEAYGEFRMVQLMEEDVALLRAAIIGE